MRLVYVAGPYTDERGAWFVQENIKRAAEVARALWQMGFAVICPHTNTANMDGLGVTYQQFIAGDLRMVESCDLMVVLERWETSKGTHGEIEFARQRDIPVLFWGSFGVEDELAALASQETLKRGATAVTVQEAAAILGRHAATRRRKGIKQSAGLLFRDAA